MFPAHAIFTKMLRLVGLCLFLVPISSSLSQAVDLSLVILNVIDANQNIPGQSLIFGPPENPSSPTADTEIPLQPSKKRSAKRKQKILSSPDEFEAATRAPAAVETSSTATAALASRAPILLSIEPHLWFFKLVMSDVTNSSNAEFASKANLGMSFDARFGLNANSKWKYSVHADLRRSGVVAPADKELEQSDEYIWGAGFKTHYQISRAFSASAELMLEQGLYARALDFTTLRVEQVTRPTAGLAISWNFLEWRSFTSELALGYRFLMPAKTSIYEINSGSSTWSTLKLKWLQKQTIWSGWLGYAQQAQASSLTENSRVDLMMGLGCELSF